MTIRLSDFALDEESGVYRHPKNSVFKYSDGEEVEDRIYKIISTAQDRSTFSEELEASVSDWPTKYHLSTARQNLLRHLSLDPNLSILELGAGCGAITRHLGESGALVVSIEGSFVRARIARERCKDLKNVRIYNANFQDIEFDQEFDIVTLIGVLEYAPVYFSGSQPVYACLDMAFKALKENGTLVLAIENQLGLKYFAGSPEDHLGKPFFGIEGRYSSGTPITFGKKKIRRILNDVGFNSLEFQYPFPDYKLPQVVFREDAFSVECFHPEEILAQIDYNEHYSTNDRTFDERMAWMVVHENGLTGDLANSFLILARKSQSQQPELTDKEVLAVYYSSRRKAQFQTATTIIASSKQEIFVRKRRIVDSLSLVYETPAVRHILRDARYIPGKNLWNLINREVRLGRYDSIVRYLTRWKEYLLKEGAHTVDHKHLARSQLRGDFIDCLPQNIIINGESLEYIDREWEFKEGCSLGSVLLRYIHMVLTNEEYLRLLKAAHPESPRPFGCLIRDIGIELDYEDLEDFFRLTDGFYSAVLAGWDRYGKGEMISVQNRMLLALFDSPKTGKGPAAHLIKYVKSMKERVRRCWWHLRQAGMALLA